MIDLATVVVTLIIVFVAFLVITYECIEGFSEGNRQQNPIDSMPLQYTFNPLYTNAYYYQEDNQTFVDKLKNLLGGDCANADTSIFYTKNTDMGNTDYINTLYSKLYQYILDRINSKGDGQRILQDNIRQYRIEGDRVLFDIEMLLHTEGKPTARHVSITATVSNIEEISIQNVGSIGHIPEM